MKIRYDIEKRLRMEWHLLYNHYPSIPGFMIDPCLEAIKLVEENGEAGLAMEVTLPENALMGRSVSVSAREIIDHCHLESFIPYMDELY